MWHWFVYFSWQKCLIIYKNNTNDISIVNMGILNIFVSFFFKYWFRLAPLLQHNIWWNLPWREQQHRAPCCSVKQGWSFWTKHLFPKLQAIMLSFSLLCTCNRFCISGKSVDFEMWLWEFEPSAFQFTLKVLSGVEVRTQVRSLKFFHPNLCTQYLYRLNFLHNTMSFCRRVGLLS